MKRFSHKANKNIESSKVNAFISDIDAMKRYIIKLEKENMDLRDNGTGKICPACEKERMITLTTINGGIRLCGCTYQESNKLKPNQKSLLIKGLVGE